MSGPSFELPRSDETPTRTTKEALELAMQSVIDAFYEEIGGIVTGLMPAGAFDASAGSFPADALHGSYYFVSVAGTVDGEVFAVGDWLVPLIDNASPTTFAGNWTRGDYSKVVHRVYDDSTSLAASLEGSRGQGALWETKDGFRYNEVASGAHLTTAGEVGLVVTGRNQFTPEAFGAVGGDAAKDTAAWNAMLRAAIGATATGPVRVYARGDYLLDQLDLFSQKRTVGTMPRQLETVCFDFLSAKLRHSGVGDGILSWEGAGEERFLTEIEGGQFIPHANTKWLTRSFDARTSQIKPEMWGTPAARYNSIGHLALIWRTWSENMTFGDKGGTTEARNLAHGLVCGRRAESWALEAYWQSPARFVTGGTSLGTYTDDAAAVAAKGAAAVEGDCYYRTSGGTAGFRVHRGSDWVDAMWVRGDVIGWRERATGTTNPSSPVKGDLYYNSSAAEVRVYDGSAWQVAHEISDVDTGLTSAESFARMSIYDMVYASCYDESYDGIGILCLGGALYDSRIHGGQGNVTNGGGSLIYLDGNYFVNTTIRDYGLEKANVPANARSVIIRMGPDAASNLKLPHVENISWTGGDADQVDPDAGLIFSGEWSGLVDLTAGVPATIVPAGAIKPGVQFEVVVSTNGNEVLTGALVKRKIGTVALKVIDRNATSQIVRFTKTRTLPAVAHVEAAGGVTIVETNGPHGLRTGDQVKLIGVQGMTEINGQVSNIIVDDAIHFRFPNIDSAGYGAYTGGGYIENGLLPGTSLHQIHGPRFVAPRGGSLVGITATTSADVSAGYVNAEPRISLGDLDQFGGNPGLDARIDGGFFARTDQEEGADTFAAGNSLYAVIETSADFAGPDDIQVDLELRVNGRAEFGQSAAGDLTLKVPEDAPDVRIATRIVVP
ncbi:ubiquitin-activating E1 FCCH domain-containing protein [Roseivivax sediminis]|uniref:Ubiquitin-activating enzyme E1 FCCH domain-containing protein n=1 Tax=Roseivivax sediminis TaxID=936889 RepID=A0A1I1YKU8_9RHOB|nr:ubiquitin-activating E1 FCCH domain-containing protein [Roseivivax sediminis]SFE19922.1 Ubiquitin-activating enzyme E1 FCCH domain-containing protein [Roseivivax sediminis]